MVRNEFSVTGVNSRELSRIVHAIFITLFDLRITKFIPIVAIGLAISSLTIRPRVGRLPNSSST